MSKPKFLVVDDSRTIRIHLKQLIRQVDGDVIGEAANGEEGVKLYGELRPDIMLLDVNMPKMDGCSALRQVMAQWPEAVVLMLTSQDTMEVIEQCVTLGARNYILKSNADEAIIAELKSTLEQVASAKPQA